MIIVRYASTSLLSVSQVCFLKFNGGLDGFFLSKIVVIFLYSLLRLTLILLISSLQLSFLSCLFFSFLYMVIHLLSPLFAYSFLFHIMLSIYCLPFFAYSPLSIYGCPFILNLLFLILWSLKPSRPNSCRNYVQINSVITRQINYQDSKDIINIFLLYHVLQLCMLLLNVIFLYSFLILSNFLFLCI